MKSFCHNMRKVEKGGGNGEMCNDGKCSKHTGKHVGRRGKERGFGALLINEKRRGRRGKAIFSPI